MPTMVKTLVKCAERPKMHTVCPECAASNEQLDDQSDAAGVDVINFREVQQDELGRVLGQRFVGAEDGIFRGAGDIALKTEDGYRIAGGGLELVNVRFGLALHLSIASAFNWGAALVYSASLFSLMTSRT